MNALTAAVNAVAILSMVKMAFLLPMEHAMCAFVLKSKKLGDHMPHIKLTKNDIPIEVTTATPQGYKLLVQSVSRYTTEDGYDIVSFYKPYYRNGYSSWNGNIERKCWALIKDGKSLFSSMAQRGLSDGTKKACISALKYIKEHGELPAHLSSEMSLIERGKY